MEAGKQSVVRVPGIRGPAKAEHFKVAGDNVVDECAALHAGDLHGNADLSQLHLHHLSRIQTLLVLVTGHRAGKSVGITGLSQKFLGLLNVALMRGKIIVVSPDRLAHRSLGNSAGALIDNIADGVHIDGHIDGLTDLDIIKGSNQVVQADEVDRRTLLLEGGNLLNLLQASKLRMSMATSTVPASTSMERLAISGMVRQVRLVMAAFSPQ